MPRTASAADILPLTQLPPLSRLLVNLALTLARWDDRRRTRQALSRLDARLLGDIGLTTGTVDGESLKPFWRD
ncbi:MAG: DUF1127 domain-containing protein [Rhodobacter sp.]|jgi:uncharacterized protein YjiS (DUF1127 family)|nr:DUF1127 domain-containing protein [Rhodobacter sp.]